MSFYGIPIHLFYILYYFYSTYGDFISNYFHFLIIRNFEKIVFHQSQYDFNNFFKLNPFPPALCPDYVFSKAMEKNYKSTSSEALNLK